MKVGPAPDRNAAASMSADFLSCCGSVFLVNEGWNETERMAYTLGEAGEGNWRQQDEPASRHQNGADFCDSGRKDGSYQIDASELFRVFPPVAERDSRDQFR